MEHWQNLLKCKVQLCHLLYGPHRSCHRGPTAIFLAKQQRIFFYLLSDALILFLNLNLSVSPSVDASGTFKNDKSLESNCNNCFFKTLLVYPGTKMCSSIESRTSCDFPEMCTTTKSWGKSYLLILIFH